MGQAYSNMMGSRLGPDWTELTRECLLDILSRLSLEQRWTGPMFVCKTWMNACKDPSLNLVLDLETQFLSIHCWFRWWWGPEFGKKMDSMLRSVVDQSKGSLREIRVRHCTDQSISYAAERCPNLEVLSVKYCPKITDESMCKIALNCPKLKELDISYSYRITGISLVEVGINCKNLQILKQNLMDPFETINLHHVRLGPSNFSTFGNADALVIREHMHQLKHLELRFSNLTDKVLLSICKKCLNLEYLDLFGCGYLTSDGVTKAISTLKNFKEIKTPIFTASLFD